MNHERIKQLYLLKESISADVMIISKNENIRYISGFNGDDTILLIMSDKMQLLTDSRYIEQAKAEADGFEIIEQKKGLWYTAASVLSAGEYAKIAFEAKNVSFASYEKLRSGLSKTQLLIPSDIDQLRSIKDKEEISCIKKAAAISDEAFQDILHFIEPGISEKLIAARLENTMRRLGSEKPSFTTIVASGARGSLPHGVPTEKLIVPGEFVTMDYGAVYGGYHSDITRTVCVGKADEKHRFVYDIVLQAQAIGVSNIKEGISGCAVDAASRKYISAKGYGEFFGHGLGHSLGLEIHEEPTLSPSSKCGSLQAGMLVTVEPGIYLPGWGGVRIEDTVLVTDRCGIPLTKSSKALLEINY